MRRASALAGGGLVVALAVAGCGGERRAESGGGEASSTAAAGPRGDGVISGVVRFTGAAPVNPPIAMAEEPKCRAKYGTEPRDPQVVVANGRLANVFVYVKEGPPVGAGYDAPSTPVTIDQDGCLYHPRVSGVMVNQPIAITNSDSLLHNIKAVPRANRPFNISQPAAGMATTRTFGTPEVMVPLECNVHGWMHAYVGVLPHPFFAVSGADGSFSITGLPPGTYTLEAWHEKFGTLTATATVTGAAPQTADFTFAAN